LAQRDDVYLVGSPRDVAAAFRVLEHGLKELNIVVQPAKSSAYAPDSELLMNEELADIIAGFQLSSEGLIACGSPIGSNTFITDQLAQIMIKHPAFFRRLKLMDPQCGLLLLRECGLPMATWITRTVKPDLVGPFARKFDEQIIDAWRALVDYSGEITAAKLDLLTSPFREGGCGLRSMEDVSPIAHYASLVGTFNVVGGKNAGIQEVIDAAKKAKKQEPVIVEENASLEQHEQQDSLDQQLDYIPPPPGEFDEEIKKWVEFPLLIKLQEAWETAEDKVYRHHPSPHFPSKFSHVLAAHTPTDPDRRHNSQKSLQTTLTHATASSKAKQMLHVLRQDNETAEVARIISQKDSGSSAAHTVLPNTEDLVLPADACRMTEKIRAGVLRLSNEICACKTGRVEMGHVLGCKKCRSLFIRHDSLVRLLLNVCKRVGMIARDEVMVDSNTSKRMDLVLVLALKRWFDVSVINPTAPSYVARAAQEEGYAARVRESAKDGKWKRLAEKKGVKFTPAVFEATGKRGEGVKGLLKLIAEHALMRTDRDVSTEGKAQVFKSMFIREITQHISIMMAHCNSMIVEESEMLAVCRDRPRFHSQGMLARARIHEKPSLNLN
jgi:hypothetical protein